MHAEHFIPLETFLSWQPETAGSSTRHWQSKVSSCCCSALGFVFISLSPCTFRLQGFRALPKTGEYFFAFVLIATSILLCLCWGLAFSSVLLPISKSLKGDQCYGGMRPTFINAVYMGTLCIAMLSAYTLDGESNCSCPNCLVL